MIRFVLNVLWLVFGGGLVLAAGYGVAALICFALVVTIPFGVASLRLAVYSLWPFGRTVVPKPGAGVPSGLTNILWVVLAGWWLALSHILAGVALCLTVIGIPVRNRELQARTRRVLAPRARDHRRPMTSPATQCGASRRSPADLQQATTATRRCDRNTRYGN